MTTRANDMQSSSQFVTSNKPTPSFYRPDALPVAHPTVSTEGKILRHLCCDCSIIQLRWLKSRFLCCVQIATGTTTYVFDILQLGELVFPAGLGGVLESEEIQKVGHGRLCI